MVVIIFSTLIFNEVLIINLCGLNKNTRKGFLKKEKMELQEINNDNSSDDEDNSEDKEEILDVEDENKNKKDNNSCDTGNNETNDKNNSKNDNSVSAEDIDNRETNDF